MVIVGGGFGGLSAARALRNAPVNVTLIDKRNYHLFRPMLYQVATGLLSADEISGPLRSIFSDQKNIDVLLDEVTGIDSGHASFISPEVTCHTTSLSSRLASSTTILGTTNGDSSLQALNRSMMPTSSAAKYFARSSELKRWLRLNMPEPEEIRRSLPSRSSVAGP